MPIFKDIFDYNQNTGKLYWKIRICKKMRVGEEAGCEAKNGYIVIRVYGRLYYAHRIAWSIMTDEDINKFGEIDHENRIRNDNRWENLRPATSSQQKANASKKKRCSSKYKGVTWNKDANLWVAQIKRNKKNYNLGSYKKEEDAALAYQKKAVQFFGGYAYSNL